MEFPRVNRFKPETVHLSVTGFDAIQSDKWLADIRMRAKPNIEKFGLPTSKLERWKYTNILPKLQNMNLKYTPTAIDFKPDSWAINLMDNAPRGQDSYNDMMLWWANTTMMNALNVHHVQKNETKQITQTISASSEEYLVPRNLIKLEEGADVILIERYAGTDAYWQNALTQIELGKNARLKHYKIQNHSDKSLYTHTTHINIDRDASYESFTLNIGGGMSRDQIHADLRSENASCAVSAVNLLSRGTHQDTTLLVEHHAPHCRSDQNVKTILADSAKGIFQGKIHVHQAAQDTDGYQLSNALLLSDRAEMNTKPELEIYADDVRCSHGATSGQLDETPMFYLRQRGLNEAQARKLLLEAFVGEVFETIKDDTFKAEIQKISEDWIHTHA